MNHIENKHCLSSNEAATYLGLSNSTLKQSRLTGDRSHHIPSPPFLKIGRKVIYLKPDLDLWLEKFRVHKKAI
jgi:hypothetical protein